MFTNTIPTTVHRNTEHPAAYILLERLLLEQFLLASTIGAPAAITRALINALELVIVRGAQMPSRLMKFWPANRVGTQPLPRA